MYISERLRENNIAEYLLYMWQVEDIIRANGLDIERLREGYLSQFGAEGKQKEQLEGWYEQLIAMMREEGVEKKGHLQINKNIIIMLTDLHLRLLRTPKFADYSAAYYHILPFIVELRAKNRQGGEEEKDEMETCLDALYGLMLLHLQGKKVSGDTELALAEVAKFMALLSNYYKKEKAGELDFD
ncbi:MAG: DUF4924 family protein [Bacteroidaceae bacterium]|nr:DUF4924 family protein [Bacteroidaceae bacterium]